MQFFVLALLILLASGALSALCGRWGARVAWIGPAGAVTGGALGTVFAVRTLCIGTTPSLLLPWSMPGGALHLQADALSLVFLLPVFGLGALAAVYGAGYFRNHPRPASVAASWFFYNLLVASMALVAVAHNAILFLLAWEAMAFSSFFLVTFDNDRDQPCVAGWVYMVATHLGAACLVVLFLLLGNETGSLDFTGMAAASGTRPAALAGWIFVLAVLGFGSKAGFMPFHTWLPEAHPAAPSHVSALMSGVMIKTGIYGLLRILTFLGPPPAWWGWCLVAVGLISGVMGVLLALAQHDLKRLLAYSSVENVGIITAGLGIGLLGLSHGHAAVAVLGFAGALLHVLHHALFKGLLFLGAGAVLHGAGTLAIDRLGGLMRRMPVTAGVFLTGCAAICALPPLNGFVSEFLVYLSAFTGIAAGPATLSVAGLAVLAGLGLIGGLAVACFVKAFGIVFLGEPRTADAAHAHEADRLMRVAMIALAAGCVVMAAAAPLVVRAIAPAIAVLVNAPDAAALAGLDDTVAMLWRIVAAGLILVALTAAIAWGRHKLLAGRTVTTAGTWDCGYAQPDARMQYTGSSFAQPLTSLFQGILGTRTVVRAPRGLFPKETAALATETRDPFDERAFRPLFVRAADVLAHLRRLQHGRVQLYVLYIAVTLILLLLFNLR